MEDIIIKVYKLNSKGGRVDIGSRCTLPEACELMDEVDINENELVTMDFWTSDKDGSEKKIIHYNPFK